MNINQRLELIKRNTLEIITEPELKRLLANKKKPIMYLGVAPTGKIHLGYFVTALKIKDFLTAGIKFKYLLADIHSYLDDRKSPWKLIKARAEYYKEALSAIFKVIGVNPRDIEFVLGSTFQKDSNYVMDLYQMMGDVTFMRARRAASEVVRFSKNVDVGGYVYPLMQINDIIGLKVDLVYAGIDQRGIYMLGRELLPKLGKKKVVNIFTPLLTGLTGGKMSASKPETNICVHDSLPNIQKKVLSAYCPAGDALKNPVLEIAKFVLFPLLKKLEIERPARFGGNITYKSYFSLEQDFKAKKLHPADLKASVSKQVVALIAEVQKQFKSKMGLLKRAYP